MTTRIGLVSDVHASPAPLRQALDIFRQEQVDDIICVGDIAGYHDDLQATIDLLEQSNCRAVIGNHDQSYLEKTALQPDESIRAYLQRLPPTLELAVEGQKVMVVHANPPSQQHGGIKLLDPQGALIAARVEQWREELACYDFNVLIVGHTHQVYAVQLGDVFVVNPGSSVFNHSCMILTLPDLTAQTYALGAREIVPCWNFGMLYDPASGIATL